VKKFRGRRREKVKVMKRRQGRRQEEGGKKEERPAFRFHREHKEVTHLF